MIHHVVWPLDLFSKLWPEEALSTLHNMINSAEIVIDFKIEIEISLQTNKRNIFPHVPGSRENFLQLWIQLRAAFFSNRNHTVPTDLFCYQQQFLYPVQHPQQPSHSRQPSTAWATLPQHQRNKLATLPQQLVIRQQQFTTCSKFGHFTVHHTQLQSTHKSLQAVCLYQAQDR